MIVISICTIPSRTDSLIKVLQHIELQTIRPDKVFITICAYYPRLQQAYPPEDLDKLNEFIKGSPLSVTIVTEQKDNGPCMKVLTPMIHGDLSDDSLILAMDDDCCYLHPQSIETLIDKYEESGKAIYGFMGVSEEPSKPIMFIHAEQIGHNGTSIVDGLGGYRGVMYPKFVLKDIVEWTNVFLEEHDKNGIVCLHSDQVLSYYCRYYNIKQRVVSFKESAQYGLIQNKGIFDDPVNTDSLLIIKSIIRAKYLKQRPTIRPIGFCIDENLFRPLKSAKLKTQAFSHSVPNFTRTYVFNNEYEYMDEYEKSFYALTCKKAGWDCFRHLEIIAAGCVPYFENIEQCPEDVLTFFPKASIIQAMNLPGVSRGNIDMKVFSVKRYEQLRREIYLDTMRRLSCRAMAQYVLSSAIPVSGREIPKVLFLCESTAPDYLRCLLLIGLKQLLGDANVLDYPRIPHIYDDYSEDTTQLYGRGFNYVKRIHSCFEHDRTTESVISQVDCHAFDLVIYGSLHRGAPVLWQVRKSYKPEEIIYVCGEDIHDLTTCVFSVDPRSLLFIRELSE